MNAFSRDRMDAFWQRWLAANRKAERERDWRQLADFYAADATYGWMYSPDEHFMAIGREEIRDYALGTEMAGLDGWHYDYVATVTDDVACMIVGFWKQRAGITDENDREYEVVGIGGSWFGYGEDAQGNGRFEWQRDWFDLPAAAETFVGIAKAGKASDGLLERMSLDGMSQPGHYRWSELPATVWPSAVEGEHR